jgi:hypothetical protein
LDTVYGGVNVVQIEVDSGSEYGINAPSFLAFLAEFETFAAQQPEVSGAYSYSQLLSMMNEIWEAGAPGSFRIPKNPFLLGIFTMALQSQNLPFLAALCDPKFQTAYLIVRTQDMPSDLYLAVLDRIIEFGQTNKPEGVEVRAAEGIHSVLEADRRILRSQTNTAGATVAIIGLALTLLWRSPRLASVSLLCNAIPVAMVLAAAGFAKIPLNSVTVMVAAIAMGVAVDDSVHFLTYWREKRRQGLDRSAAILATFEAKTRPIISSSLVLMGIFGVFWIASFPPLVHFGLLCALAFGLALLSALLVLPAILGLDFRKRRETAANSGSAR